MKIYCANCEKTEELSSDELKEVSEFVLNNELEAIDYLNYISLKRGKICNNKKNHLFLFDMEWQEHLIKILREKEALIEKYNSNEKVIEEIKGKLKELEHQVEIKVKENNDLELKEHDIRNEVIKITGNIKLELWK